MIDRKKGPPIHTIKSLKFPDYHQEVLSNGIRYHEVNNGTQELVQLELIFLGGRHTEPSKGVARAAARLAREGTKSFSSAEIAEEIDYYGANLSMGANLDYSFVKCFALSKYIEQLLPVLSSILHEATFPEGELDNYILTSKQKLKVDNARSELLAYKYITEHLFGPNHVYGYNSTPEIYDELNRSDILQHYESNYSSNRCVAIVSGKISKKVRQLIINFLLTIKEKDISIDYTPPISSYSKRHFFHKGLDEHQNAIKIGKRLFQRDHPDFVAFYLLNTVLGGYFGSRLMSSIREQKGFTYSIYSGLDLMIYDGYFYISTEVGNSYVKETLSSIYEEIEKLQQNPIPEDELFMVKNYLSGNFLNMIDGPFKIANIIKMMAVNGLEKNYLEKLTYGIHHIDANRLMEVAQKYLQKNDMIEVLVGAQENGQIT